MSDDKGCIYTVVLHAEAGRYCVTIPEIGLTWGTTAEAALTMAAKLIDTQYRVSANVPEPRSFAEVTAPAGDTKISLQVGGPAEQRPTSKKRSPWWRRLSRLGKRRLAISSKDE